MLALAILPGNNHFPSDSRIPWQVQGCAGEPQAVLQRWQGDWLSANGVYLDPPEWQGSLQRLTRIPLKSGAYRLTVRAGDCTASRDFTVAPYFAVVRWDRHRLVLSASRFRDGSPVQNLKFSVRDGNSVFLLGSTGRSNYFVMDMPEQGSEVRIVGPDGEPASITFSRLSESEVSGALQVFASKEERNLKLLFVSPKGRDLLLKNSAGDVFGRTRVESPFTVVTLPGFKKASVWVVEEGSEGSESVRATSGTPPWIWIPGPDGIKGIASQSRGTELSLTVGWSFGERQKASVSFAIPDDTEFPFVAPLGELPHNLSGIRELWAGGRSGRIYYRWEEEDKSVRIPGEPPGWTRYFRFTADAVQEIQPGREMEADGGITLPPGYWILRENLSNGTLWVDRHFVSLSAMEEWNMPRILDPIVGGSCVRLQVADTGPVAVLVTDPEFSPETLTDVTPVNVASTQPVFLSRSPRFLEPGLPATVFRIAEGTGPGNIQLCLPPSPGIYRVTTLSRRSGRLLPRSFTMTIGEGVANDTTVEEVPPTPFSYRIKARLVNASGKPKDVLIRTDLPIGVTLEPGTVKEYEREFQARPGDRLIAILRDPEALLMDRLLEPELEWDETLPGVATRLLQAEKEWEIASALADLYEFAAEDGFAWERGTHQPDLEATAMAYLAMKRAGMKGAYLDARRFTLAENFLRPNMKSLPDWFKLEAGAPQAVAMPEFPRECAVFPEDLIIWKGERDDRKCPVRGLGFQATVERKGPLATLVVDSPYPVLPSEHFFVYATTGHCESPMWMVIGGTATGFASRQSLQIDVRPEGVNRLELRISCKRGVVGDIRIWAPLQGGLRL